MNYIKKEIIDGVNLHLIINNNFKTDLTVIFLTVPLEKETVTKNALLPAVLKSGTEKYHNYKEITTQLKMMYGATFDCGVDKNGDNLVLKFYIESLNDNYLPEKNNNLLKSLEILIDIVCNPLIEHGTFKEEYIKIEKHNLELLINSQKDDKDAYALDTCINKMYKNSGYGLNKYGTLEELNKIDKQNLYSHYEKLIDSAKIDIFVSGEFEKENIINFIEENELIKKLKPRKENINLNNFKNEIKDPQTAEKEEIEEMDIAQGKLVIGLDILPNDFEDFRFIAIIYNAIFGSGVGSKLFQIVREKESLAYTAKSEYIVQKNNIFIRCGIECDNYEKTVKLIKKLLEDMKQGNFSEDDIMKAKEYIDSGVNLIETEQDTQIIYLFGQELSKLPLEVEEYKKKIQEVTREQITKFANLIKLNTVYFLRNGGQDANN